MIYWRSAALRDPPSGEWSACSKLMKGRVPSTFLPADRKECDAPIQKIDHRFSYCSHRLLLISFSKLMHLKMFFEELLIAFYCQGLSDLI